MIASCLLILNSSTHDERAQGAVAGCDTEVVEALQPSGDDSPFDFVYCLLHATRTDWRYQAEDDHGPDPRDGSESVFRDRATEGSRALQDHKQTGSAHRPALRFFRAPAVSAHCALARVSCVLSRLISPVSRNRILSPVYRCSRLKRWTEMSSQPLGVADKRFAAAIDDARSSCGPVAMILQHAFHKCCSIAERCYQCHFATGINPASIAFAKRVKKCG